MIKLLKFFIPNTAKNIILFFAIAIGICIILLLSPMERNDARSFSGIILMGLFPFYVYFNPTNYLSASLGWILQTPVPKFQIILANGILNLFKVLFISALLWLVNIYLKMQNPNADGTQFLPSIKYNDPYQASSIFDYYHLIFFIVASSAVLLGILPDLLKNAQEHKSHGQQFSLKNMKSKKSIIISVIFFSLFMSIELFDFPSFIIYNFLFSTGVLLAIYLTLNSVKYVYNKKKLFISGFLLFTAGSLASYSMATLQISDRRISLNDRFQIAEFLGNFRGNAYDILLDEVMQGSQTSITIGIDDLKPAFSKEENKEKIRLLTTKLVELCNNRNDHTCRHAALVRNYQRKDIDWRTTQALLHLGCPKDLKSCLMMTSSPLEKEELDQVESILTKKCSKIENRFQLNVCLDFYKRKS